MKHRTASGRPPDIPGLFVHLVRSRLAERITGRRILCAGLLSIALLTAYSLSASRNPQHAAATVAPSSKRPPSIPPDVWTPSITTQGREWAIGWTEPAERSMTVRFARLAADGHPLGASSVVAPPEAGIFRRYVSVAHGGYGTAIAWSETARDPGLTGTRCIRVARLRDDGSVEGVPSTMPCTFDSLDPMIAASRFRLGVAWIAHNQAARRFEQHFAQLDAAGRLVGDERVVRTEAALLDMEGLADIDMFAYGLLAPAADPSRSRDALALVRLRDDGVEESSTTLTQRPVGRAAIDPAGGAFAAVWTEREKPLQHMPRASVAFATVDRSGIALRPRRIVPPCVMTEGADVAASDDAFGVVWESAREDDEATGGARVVWFMRLNGDGVPAGAPLRLSADGETARAPAIAWNGTRWGVAWGAMIGRQQSVHFVTIDSAGRRLGPPMRLAGVDQAESDAR